MTKENLTPRQVFVNDNRKDAAKWMYRIVLLAPSIPAADRSGTQAIRSAEHTINDLAAHGWEPCMMSSEVVLLRRDATDAMHDDEDRPRAELLKTATFLDK